MCPFLSHPLISSKRFPGGPTDGPPGKEFGLKVCWWSSGWTTGQRCLLPIGPTLSPIRKGGSVLTSLRSHPLIDSTGWCRCVPLSVSPSHQFEKVSWWSNGWTTGKGIRSKSVLVVQRVDHRAKVLASYRSHPLTDSEGWFRFDVPSVPPPHRFDRVVPLCAPFCLTLSSVRKGFLVVQRMDHRERNSV